MQIEDNTILIAPGALHLRLYEEIYRQKGSCLNITVLSLEAYLNRHLTKPKPSTAGVLYDYAAALEALSPGNMFYGSRHDYDFLKACHSFMTLAQLHDFQAFPQDTPRERDLYEIISLLMPIDLWVKDARDLPFDDASRVRILNTERDPLSAWWIERLLEKGAKPLGEPQHRRYYSWMASNPHKEMEVCADAIVANGLEAQSVLVALAEPQEKYALAQAFESRRIPYTFLQEDSSSKILVRWQSALRYVMEPDDSHLMELLKVMFPVTGYDLRRWLELYGTDGPAGSLQDTAYVENALISEEEFAGLQDLDIQVSAWRDKLREIRAWDLDSFDQIGALIMDQTPEPDEDDLRIYQGVLDIWQQVRHRIHHRKDLSIFIRSLDALHPSSALSQLKGVLIGDRSVISCLHETVFCIGADAAHFPGFGAASGIFGEDYLEKLEYSPLESRMQARFDALKSVLAGPKDVYFLSAQSDYEGKSLEASHELSTWLEVLPKFKAAAQSSMNIRPSFSLEGLSSQVFFETDQKVVSTRARQLKSYDDCPLKTLLQYGLQLRKPVRARDALRISNRLPSIIMQKAQQAFGRPFHALGYEEILQLVDEDFQFARRILPARKEEIDTLAQLCARRLLWLFEGLRPLCTEMGMTLCEGDYRIDLHEELQGLPVEITGSVSMGGRSHASFNLYAEEGQEGFTALDPLPAGTLDLSLQPKASSRPAFSLSYGRGAAQALAAPVSTAAAAEKAQEEFLRRSMSAQNFENPKPGLMQVLARKVPSYQEREQSLVQQADVYARGIVRNDFIPLHRPSACQYCSYRAICRNAAVEKGE